MGAGSITELTADGKSQVVIDSTGMVTLDTVNVLFTRASPGQSVTSGGYLLTNVRKGKWVRQVARELGSDGISDHTSVVSISYFGKLLPGEVVCGSIVSVDMEFKAGLPESRATLV